MHEWTRLDMDMSLADFFCLFVSRGSLICLVLEGTGLQKCSQTFILQLVHHLTMATVYVCMCAVCIH